MIKHVGWLSSLAMVLLSGCAYVPPAPVQPVQAPAPAVVAERAPAPPVMERRESLTATGYAVISVQKHELPAQQRLLAIRASKLDAYRGLVEQVYGQYIDATTTVADMVVKSDSFRARVEGVVYGARLVSIAPVGEDTYETTLSLDERSISDLRQLYVELMRKRER